MISGAFAGCAQLPAMSLWKPQISQSFPPPPLMGYELAHNLNLQHDLFDIANLLALFFPPGTVLTEKRVNNLPEPASADRPYW